MANAHGTRADGWDVRHHELIGVLTALCSVALGAGLSACGSSSTSTTTRTITASATSTGPTAAQKATDQAIANNSTPKLGDFPSGWVQSDKQSSASTARCRSSSRKGNGVRPSNSGPIHDGRYRRC